MNHHHASSCIIIIIYHHHHVSSYVSPLYLVVPCLQSMHRGKELWWLFQPVDSAIEAVMNRIDTEMGAGQGAKVSLLSKPMLYSWVLIGIYCYPSRVCLKSPEINLKSGVPFAWYVINLMCLFCACTVPAGGARAASTSAPSCTSLCHWLFGSSRQVRTYPLDLDLSSLNLKRKLYFIFTSYHDLTYQMILMLCLFYAFVRTLLIAWFQCYDIICHVLCDVVVSCRQQRSNIRS